MRWSASISPLIISGKAIFFHCFLCFLERRLRRLRRPSQKNARGAERLQQVQCGYFTWVCPPGIGNEVWTLVVLVRDKLPMVPSCSAFHHCSSYGFLGKLAICFIVLSFSILSWPCFIFCSYQSLDKTKQGAELCDLPMLRCFVWKV